MGFHLLVLCAKLFGPLTRINFLQLSNGFETSIKICFFIFVLILNHCKTCFQSSFWTFFQTLNARRDSKHKEVFDKYFVEFNMASTCGPVLFKKVKLLNSVYSMPFNIFDISLSPLLLLLALSVLWSALFLR